jgi:acyl carrier protein
LLTDVSSDISDRVSALVRRIVAKRARARKIGPDEDLRACGLSSLEIVTLMLSVETEFALRIPERQMVPGNFRSIARVADLISALLHPPAASARQR